MVRTAVDAKISPRKSQLGRFTLLGHPDLRRGDEGYVHFIGIKSGIIKRTHRSTFRAEARGMFYAIEASDNLRVVIFFIAGHVCAQ